MLALLFAALLQPAHGEGDWVELGSSDERAGHVDRASVEREGTRVRFWLRLSYDRPQPDGWQIMLAQIEIDCAARTERARRYVARRADGSDIRAADFPLSLEPFEPIRPGGNIDIMSRTLCGRTPG